MVQEYIGRFGREASAMFELIAMPVLRDQEVVGSEYVSESQVCYVTLVLL